MSASFKIGHLTFSSPLIQGPLAGYSSAPLRELVWQHADVAYCVTEMISANALVGAPEKILRRYVNRAESEKTLCLQISANQADMLAKACELLKGQPIDLIDLNCGCPVKKIRAKHAGSKHLSAPGRLEQFIKTMRAHSNVPVTVKIRVDGSSDEQFNRDVAAAVQAGGADALTVHGRHWTERYDVAVHYDQIASFIETLAIPVIGNGDVCDLASYQRMLDLGCSGIMIARAGVGQPWLFAEINAALQNKPFQKPSRSEVLKTFVKHIEGLVTLLNSEFHALLQARKLAKYYARDFPDRDAFCQMIYPIETWDEFISYTTNVVTI